MRRVGILGGTFDPIHYGHLAAAEEARCLLDLDCVYVVPVAQQPLKSRGHTASPQQRLEMVRLACVSNPSFIPSDMELRRTPPSFTIDTVLDFQARLGHNTLLWFILGGDALMELPHWREAERLIRLAYFAVIVRPGTAIDQAALNAHLPGLAQRITLIDGLNLDISSSVLRRRIAVGQPVRYQLPDSVLDYIREQRLYRLLQEPE